MSYSIMSCQPQSRAPFPNGIIWATLGRNTASPLGTPLHTEGFCIHKAHVLRSGKDQLTPSSLVKVIDHSGSQ